MHKMCVILYFIHARHRDLNAASRAIRFPGASVPEIADLHEVETMLAERVIEWTKEWKQQGLEQGRQEWRQEGGSAGSAPVTIDKLLGVGLQCCG